MSCAGQAQAAVETRALPRCGPWCAARGPAGRAAAAAGQPPSWLPVARRLCGGEAWGVGNAIKCTVRKPQLPTARATRPSASCDATHRQRERGERAVRLRAGAGSWRHTRPPGLAAAAQQGGVAAQVAAPHGGCLKTLPALAVESVVQEACGGQALGAGRRQVGLGGDNSGRHRPSGKEPVWRCGTSYRIKKLVLARSLARFGGLPGYNACWHSHPAPCFTSLRRLNAHGLAASYTTTPSAIMLLSSPAALLPRPSAGRVSSVQAPPFAVVRA